MEQPLNFEGYDWNKKEQFQYPVCGCGDVKLHFWHDVEYEEVRQKWERRKKRIKWDNLFVLVIAQSMQTVEEFLKLPYEKKVCFAPFETESDEVISIKVPDRYAYIYDVLNKIAGGQELYYDVQELLCNANFKKLK